jgi:flagellin-like hook-associated protein FlgL
MANAGRSKAMSYDTVGEARRRALSLLDVTLSATESVSDVVDRMKVLALAANDPSISERNVVRSTPISSRSRPRSTMWPGTRISTG